MKFQAIDLTILLTMIFVPSINAKNRSNNLDEISLKSHEYAVHHHNYEEQNISSPNDDLQTEESTILKLKRLPESSYKFSIRPKRGNKKFRNVVGVVKQRRKKRRFINPQKQYRELPTKYPNDQTEFKVIQTFEKTHKYINEDTSIPLLDVRQHQQPQAHPQMTAAESKQYETRAEQEIVTDADLKATEHDKVKVKHHHHHHHHNHVKEKIIHVPVEKIVEKVVHIPKPYQVEKIVEKVVKVPVENIVHVPKPVPVEKIVEKKVPYPVEKIVHIPIEKVVEKIIHVPKPYPVEKVVEKIIHVPVEKVVEKIVHIPKPYPVEKIVNKVVHVPKPYPVIKPVPYPVEVKVPIEVEKPVPYHVEKKVPVPYKVEVEKKVSVPYKVEVEKKIPVYIHAHEPYMYVHPEHEKRHQQDGLEKHNTAFEPQMQRYHQPHDYTVFSKSNREASLIEKQNQNTVNNPPGQIIYGSSLSDIRSELLRQQLHNYGYAKPYNAPAPEQDPNIQNIGRHLERSSMDMEQAQSLIIPQSEALSNPQPQQTPIQQISQKFRVQSLSLEQPIVAL